MEPSLGPLMSGRGSRSLNGGRTSRAQKTLAEPSPTTQRPSSRQDPRRNTSTHHGLIDDRFKATPSLGIDALGTQDQKPSAA